YVPAASVLARKPGGTYQHRRDARERDEAERNRACGGNPKERASCRTNNPKEKAGKGVLYGKNIIYFRISYRGTSGQDVRPDFRCDSGRADGAGSHEPCGMRDMLHNRNGYGNGRDYNKGICGYPEDRARYWAGDWLYKRKVWV